MLKPLPENILDGQAGGEPTIQCESCGAETPRNKAINFVAVVGSPGHPDLPPLPPHAEHWACSPECWLKVGHACLDEHIHVLLTISRKSIGL